MKFSIRQIIISVLSLAACTQGFIEDHHWPKSSTVKPSLETVSTNSLKRTPVTKPSPLVINDKNKSRATRRKKWGVEDNNSDEYWFDQRIHMLGNRGMCGALHAALAPIATKIIDVVAYDGINIRKKVRLLLASSMQERRPSFRKKRAITRCSQRL